MGCDIHIYFECNRSIRGSNKWVSGDYFKSNPYYNGEDENEYEIVPICSGRNYELFSVLADVRNYNGIEPICQPKGLPDDCCELIKKASKDWGSDGHSHSYFTLRELQDYANKKVKTKYKGFMHPEEAAKVDKGEMPRCGAVAQIFQPMFTVNGNTRKTYLNLS